VLGERKRKEEKVKKQGKILLKPRIKESKGRGKKRKIKILFLECSRFGEAS